MIWSTSKPTVGFLLPSVVFGPASYNTLQNLLHIAKSIAIANNYYKALAQKYLLVWQGFLVLKLRFFSSSSWMRQMLWFSVATEKARVIPGPCVQSLYTRDEEQSCFPYWNIQQLSLKNTDTMMENVAKNKHEAIIGMTTAEAGQLDLMGW